MMRATDLDTLVAQSRERWKAHPRWWRCWRHVVWKYQAVERWRWKMTDRVSYDAVDLFSHNIEWLLPRLRWLREHGAGYPAPLHEDYGDTALERWQSILDEMIEGFEIALEDTDYSPEVEAKKDRAAHLLGEWFYALWD